MSFRKTTEYVVLEGKALPVGTIRQIRLVQRQLAAAVRQNPNCDTKLRVYKGCADGSGDDVATGSYIFL